MGNRGTSKQHSSVLAVGIGSGSGLRVGVGVLAAAGEAEKAIVEAVERGGGGRVTTIGGDCGRQLVVDVVPEVEGRGRRHPSSACRGIEQNQMEVGGGD
jgi:hypothetical protein